MKRMAGFGGDAFVRGRLQAALHTNRQKNKERQKEQEPEFPEPEPVAETEE